MQGGMMPGMGGGMMPGMGGMMPGMGGMMPGMGGMMPGMMPGMMFGMMPGMVGGAQGNNQEDEEWMKGFKMGVQEVNNVANSVDNQPGPKINVVFNTTQGTTHNLIFPYGTTMSEAIEKYLQRVGRPDLIGNTDKICFLVNAQKIKYNDKTPIEQYFRNNANPKIVVNDTNELIGA